MKAVLPLAIIGLAAHEATSQSAQVYRPVYNEKQSRTGKSAKSTSDKSGKSKSGKSGKSVKGVSVSAKSEKHQSHIESHNLSLKSKCVETPYKLLAKTSSKVFKGKSSKNSTKAGKSGATKAGKSGAKSGTSSYSYSSKSGKSGGRAGSYSYSSKSGKSGDRYLASKSGKSEKFEKSHGSGSYSYSGKAGKSKSYKGDRCEEGYHLFHQTQNKDDEEDEPTQRPSLPPNPKPTEIPVMKQSVPTTPPPTGPPVTGRPTLDTPGPTDQPVTAAPTMKPTCNPFDDFNICIALDASGSVCAPIGTRDCSFCTPTVFCKDDGFQVDTCCENYQNVKDFASVIVESLDDLPVEKSFSLVQFASDAAVESNLGSAQDTLDTINSLIYTGGATNHKAAFEKCMETFSTSNGNKKQFIKRNGRNRKELILVITDGISTLPKPDPVGVAEAAATVVKEEGVAIVPVFISDKRDPEAIAFMRRISTTGAAFDVTDFDSLDSIKDSLVDELACI